MQRTIVNFFLALEGVFANQLRAFLTALGIVFGVGAVIAMLAIGSGAKQSILDQMKLIGTNNIVIKAGEVQKDAEDVSDDNENDDEKKPWSPGLTLADAQALIQSIPTIEAYSPEMVINTNLITNGKLKKVKCIGTRNDYFELNNMKIERGHFFHDSQIEKGDAVCIIGKNVEVQFFSEQDALGSKIKCGNTWLTIIGILEKRVASEESLQNLGIRDANSDVYIPITTALIRFQDRSTVGKDDILSRRNRNAPPPENYHQLDRLVIRVNATEKLQATADIIARTLKRRHYNTVDYEIEVPELLLQQQRKTQDTFNLVLAVIAGISLLVGGIGIMNIMLASVLERIKEIGVRRSMGATQNDIILQFLFESVFISLIGGLIGVILGVAAARMVANYADIPTVVSAWSIILSFGVAASIGLIFGIFPAQKAALQDPIKALRTD